MKRLVVGVTLAAMIVAVSPRHAAAGSDWHGGATIGGIVAGVVLGNALSYCHCHGDGYWHEVSYYYGFPPGPCGYGCAHHPYCYCDHCGGGCGWYGHPGHLRHGYPSLHAWAHNWHEPPRFQRPRAGGHPVAHRPTWSHPVRPRYNSGREPRGGGPGPARIRGIQGIRPGLGYGKLSR